MLVDNSTTLDIINQNIKDKDDKFITIDGTTYFKDVLEVKRSVSGSLYQSNMAMLEVSIKGYFDVLDEWITYDREIASRAVNDGQSEFINYGQFKVTSCVYNDDTETTTIIAFDKMIETQKEYRQEDMQITFPTTVGTVFNRVLQVCGLETTTTTFPNSDELISEDVWANASYTYRDVLSHIAQVSGSIIGVKDDKIEVYQPTDTGFTITQSKLSKLQMGESYGKINILNLTREPQHDNYAYPENFNTIPQNERKELVFENNPIVDKERERWAPLIFPLVNDLEYREFTAEAFVGYGIFDVGDIVTVQEYNTNESYTCLITDEYTTHTQGMSGEVKSNKPFSSKEQYVVVTDERREGQKTYILVDQLNGQIILATEKIDELEDKATELGLDIDGLMARVETIHNGNIIPNLNGELGYLGWNGKGRLLQTNDLLYRRGLTITHTFIPKRFEGSLSEWGVSMYGSNETPLGYVVPDTYYSWRGKAHRFVPFTIKVNEYDKDKKFKSSKTYNFTNPSTYLTLTHTPSEGTEYMSLEFSSNQVSTSNRLELTEMMFNRGEPKAWFEGTIDVKLYAESRVSMLDDKIEFAVSEVGAVDSKINNSTVKITAKDGVEIWNNNGRGLTVYDDNNEPSIELNSSGHLIARDATISGEITAISGKIGNFNLFDGRLRLIDEQRDLMVLLGGSGIYGNDLPIWVGNSSGNVSTFYINNNSREIFVGRGLRMSPSPGVTRNVIRIDDDYKSRGYFDYLRPFSNDYIVIRDELRFEYASILKMKDIYNNYQSPITSITGGGFRGIFRQLLPDYGSGANIGSSDNRYSSIYLENQPNVSSDLRQKYAIQDIPSDLIKEISKVEPKMYLQHKTWHFGYIAQDIERALYKWATNNYGRDAKHYVDKFAFLHKDESYLSLLYGEIAVLKEKAMSERIEKLENELQEIKELLKERSK